MSDEKSRFVVSADWLQGELGKPDLRVLDASFYLPAQKRDADAEYAAGHIPGAIRFDQDKIADHSTNLPHTIPSADQFATEVGKLGISENDRIVVYDGIGMFASPRVWWLFRVMGARNVLVLDGGLDGWKAEGRYNTLSYEVNSQWDRDSRALREGAVGDLRQAVAADPKIRVTIVHGWNDLSCPFMGSVLTVDQMPVMGDASRVQVREYPGGHMFYTRTDSQAALRKDVQEMFSKH